VGARRAPHNGTQNVIKNTWDVNGFTHVIRALFILVFLAGRVSIEKDIIFRWATQEAEMITIQSRLDSAGFRSLSG
jgi:hypothetical protein